ncbi:ABC transporter substrate-binding protein [Rhizobacter sp. Root1221]|uniref:ABC transporter substrate-binding protein n=1 Tax=Rhizobacter sp. Root1221 TaxID=1736433 RepID=UPI0006F50072|nr:ABC transporter substrate-binding protein [Rhizobacter sp. Root1221]KQW00161.1 peptide ABC transporter substrate-binding protein [Rhizobacter sp. Root1221]
MKPSLSSTALLASALALGAASAHAAGTLTVCTENSPDGFDIAQYESAVTNDAAGRTLYDQLLAFKRGTTEVVPGLAEKWEVSPDGMTYTFSLRRGVKFHTTAWFKPTRDLNADDVIWSVNRINDKKHPAYAAARNGYVYWEGMGMSSLIKSVTKVDPYTVRFTLTRPETPFLADMAMEPLGSVFSAEYGEQLQKSGKLEQLNTQPIGSGPFVFKSYQKDAIIRYTANTAYWGGAPKVDNLIFAITHDPNVRVQRLKAGECLVGTNMKPETVSTFDNDPNVRILRNSPLLTAYIAPNMKHKFLSDKRFREALALAFDKKTYVASVYGGNATPAVSFMPPSMWGYEKGLADRHDVEKAKQLVKASGYDGTELALFTRIGGAIDGKRAAELMQSDWARIGVNVRVQMMEWGELLKRAGRGDHDITFVSWASDNGDPDNFLTPNLSCASVAGGSNKSQWCHKPFEALLAAGRLEKDPKKRADIYIKAQRMIYDEVAAIPTVYPVNMTALNKRVEGFVPSPFSHSDFRSVSLK